MFDVVIVGGGPVGGCAGALLARAAAGTPGLSVALLEPRATELLSLGAAVARAPHDSRVVALSRASERVLDHTGAWARIAATRLSPYERMRIWHESVAPASEAALVFDAADVGQPNLGYIVENRLLQGALLESFAEHGGHIEPAALASLEIGENEAKVLTTRGTLTARLVIGADGAQSRLRTAAGLSAEISSYAQTAIVATVATARSHEATAWQRFMREGTLAFLPLSDGTSSIVWSADEALATALLELDALAFNRELDRASDLALGATRLIGERSSFPLRRLAAPRYVARRVALIGDAAHVVHPLAGQGVNLGLLDAAALAQLVQGAVARREDPGALGVLRAYERWRTAPVRLPGWRSAGSRG
jgi:2-octaprenylphenol hydroxylase